MDENKGPSPEMPDAFWKKVYFAVVINTIVVITLLWAFSRYFK